MSSSRIVGSGVLFVVGISILSGISILLSLVKGFAASGSDPGCMLVLTATGASFETSGVAERSGSSSGGAPAVVSRRAVLIGVSDFSADGANWPMFASFDGSIRGKSSFGAEAGCFLIVSADFGILVLGT